MFYTVFTKDVLLQKRGIKYEQNCLQFLSRSICHTRQINNDNVCSCKQIPYDIITTVLLSYLFHIRNENPCGTKHTPCKFICNTVQVGTFLCYAVYIATCDYMCNSHSKS